MSLCRFSLEWSFVRSKSAPAVFGSPQYEAYCVVIKRPRLYTFMAHLSAASRAETVNAIYKTKTCGETIQEKCSPLYLICRFAPTLSKAVTSDEKFTPVQREDQLPPIQLRKRNSGNSKPIIQN